MEDLFKKALEAQARAYAPFSHYQVGCALKIKGSPEIFVGCNVENASFGATLCAERTAIFSAIAQKGKIEIESLLVITQDEPPGVPCGMCLQVIAEFAGPSTPIILANPQGTKKEMRLKDLLPYPFDSKSLHP